MGDLLLPKLSISMEEGRLVRWLVEPGAQVAEGDPVAIVETDKAEVEVEAPESGALEIVVAEGEVVPVETVIGRIGSPAAATGAPTGNGEASRSGITAADLAAGSPPAGSFAAVASNAPRRSPSPAAGAATGTSSATPTGRRFASPAARRRARELGVDLADVQGRGPGGRIVAADIEDHAGPAAAPEAPTPVGTPAPEPVAASAGGAYPTEPVAASAPARPAPASARAAAGTKSAADLRPAVIGALVRGWQTIPHVNVGGELDAEGLVAARKAASRESVKITYTDLLLLALARALRDVPELAAIVREDGSVQRASRIDLNVAVATPDGVVAPVIQDVTSLGVAGVARERARIVDAARNGQIEGRDLAPGVCTLSNLGAYPVDFFTPVLSGPQAALVATGRIAQRVVPVDGLVGVRHRVWANVCLDHRAADGEAGGRLLAALERRIADLPTSV
jgi:pyruvate dehydrogenase E2 component (dihydrolipoamide acetyltransferase)